MKRYLLFLVFINIGFVSHTQTLYDSFSDGDFTASPIWGGNTANWTVVTNSDVSTGAANSFTVRLSAPAVTQTDYLSTQIANWFAAQEWGFWIGRRAQAFTAANQSYVWLYANEANLNSSTVDGYRIAIGDDAGGDEIRLQYIVDGAVAGTVITSSGALNNGLTDIGILIRVTRTSSGLWTLYTSTLPTANGSGAVATDIPNAANAAVNQGSGTENTLMPSANGFLGFASLHSTGANAIATAEFDQFYFDQLSGNSITATTITAPPFILPNCSATATGTVDFTSIGSFISGNTYTAQLSDATGSFASAVNIGSISSTANSGTIPITIPAGTVSGTLYKIQIVSSSPAVTSSPSSVFTISLTGYCATNATDYFRSVATGSWNSLSIWQSSNDSTNWIPATLIPGASAAHVVVTNVDSVYLAANTTTINLTVNSSGIVNALGFTLTASNRFNLLNTATFYQGGTVISVPGVQQVLSTSSSYHFNGSQTPNSIPLPEFGNLFWEPTPGGAGTFQNSLSAAPFNSGLVVRGNLTINIQGITAREIRFATGSTVSRTHTIDGNLNLIGASTIVVVQNGANPSSTSGILNIGGDLNISSGAIFQGLSSTAANGGTAIVNLTGNLNNNGGTIRPCATTTAGTYTFNFTGSGNVTADAGIGNSFHDVTVAAGKTVTLQNNDLSIVSGKNLTLSGMISLGNHNLLVDGIVTGGSATSYVRTAGTGLLILNNVDAVGKQFPVGHSQYNPVLIENGSNLNWSVNVNDGVIADPPNGTTGAVLLTWNITPSVNPPPAGADITFQFDKINQVGASFNTPPYNTPDNVQAWHRKMGYWLASGTPVPLNLVSGNIYSAKVSGATQFSPYALSRVSLPLPIRLVSFSAEKLSTQVSRISWELAEQPGPGVIFDVERSQNGRDFILLTSVAGEARNRFYAVNDAGLTRGICYYRLRIKEPDGKLTYSKVAVLVNETSGFVLTGLYPNPANGQTNISVSCARAEVIRFRVLDNQGRVQGSWQTFTQVGSNLVPLNLAGLPAGMYHVVAENGEQRAQLSIVKQ